MNRLNDDNHCFVCGEKNPMGLKLNFRYSDDSMKAEAIVTFAEQFQGWSNIVHGGLLSTVLDEIMVKPAENQGLNCVTAELNVRFRKPAYVGQQYKVTGKIKEIRGRKISATATIETMEAEVITEAVSTLILIR